MLLQLLALGAQFQLLPLDRRRLLHRLYKARALAKLGQLFLQGRHPGLQLRRLLIQESQALGELFLPLPQGIRQVFSTDFFKDGLAQNRIPPLQHHLEHTGGSRASRRLGGGDDGGDHPLRQAQALLDRGQQHGAGEHLDQGGCVVAITTPLQSQAFQAILMAPGTLRRIDRVGDKQLEAALKNRFLDSLPGRVQHTDQQDGPKHR